MSSSWFGRQDRNTERPQQTRRTRRSDSNSRGSRGQSGRTHGRDSGSARGYVHVQEQVQQVQETRSAQATMTAETQMLLDQTEQFLTSLMYFAETLRNSMQDRDKVEFANKKAVGLCNAFGLTCEGFYEDETVNEEAIGLSADMILRFEARVSTEYGDVFSFVDPMINYAKRAIKGEPTQNLRCVLTPSRPQWSQEVANQTMQSFQAARHAVKDREREVVANHERYRREHDEKWRRLGGTSPRVGPTRPSQNLDSFYQAMGPAGSHRYDGDSEVVEEDAYVMDVDGRGEPIL